MKEGPSSPVVPDTKKEEEEGKGGSRKVSRDDHGASHRDPAGPTVSEDDVIIRGLMDRLVCLQRQVECRVEFF
ncbi:hypothetical protein ACOMHN_039380 [Nucella lapillus]